jgi:hypothetical protein
MEQIFKYEIPNDNPIKLEWLENKDGKSFFKVLQSFSLKFKKDEIVCIHSEKLKQKQYRNRFSRCKIDENIL